MTKSKTTKLYDKHISLIRKYAWKYATNEEEFKERMAQGNFIFMKAVNTWPKKDVLFSTWLVAILKREIMAFNIKNQPALEYTEYHSRATVLSPDTSIMWKEKLSSLSSEASHIASLILSGPSEALNIINEPPKMIRGAIVRYLKKRGNTTANSWKVMKELRESFR